MGKIARAYRQHPYHHPVYGDGGISQRLLGQWLGSSQAQVSRIENGPPLRNLDILTHWARTLRIPSQLLWFRVSDRQKITEDPIFAGLENHDLRNLELTSLLNSLAADGLPLLECRSEGTRFGVTGIDGMSLLETTNLLLKVFFQLDDELGGDALYPPLSRYVGRLAVNVKDGADDDLVAFGQLAQMAGWLALDANHHAAARRYFTTAVYVSHEADDSGLGASALAYLSLQETYRARPTSALSLAQTAFTMGNGRLTPLTMTMIGTRLARAHASLHQNAECLRTLDQAQTEFGNHGHREEPLWISYVDEVELAAQEGACYLDLGMTAKASAALTRALDLLQTRAPHRLRDRVHYLSRLAKCFLLDGEVARACEIADTAFALSAEIGSARVVDRLIEFHKALEPFSESEPARAFCEQFKGVIASRHNSVTHEGPA